MHLLRFRLRLPFFTLEMCMNNHTRCLFNLTTREFYRALDLIGETMSIDDITPEQWDSTSYVQNKEQNMPSLDTKEVQWERKNSGKPDVSLVPSEYILGAARALSYGAEKYSAGNYLNGEGMPLMVVYASLMRHLMAWRSGEDRDDESGLLHTDHIGANLAMLVDLIDKNKGKDERF